MNSLLELVWSQRTDVWTATLTHLSLVVEATLIAALIGIPLGILSTRRAWVERVVLGFANVFQTVPSLALLGFLLILFGGVIGKPPALTALVIYALLPIIKNTILGIRGLDPNLSEASTGLGMTAWQKLILVELPLAVPILLGGVRIAAVSVVGMATIAASIGAGGLGTFIFRGVSLSDPRLILLGAIPSACLAILIDGFLAQVERRLDPRAVQSRTSVLLFVIPMVAVFGLLLVGNLVSKPKTDVIVIGSKDGTEMIILGHMLAELVQDRTGLVVERKFNLGGSLVCYNALKQGGLDAYVEYSGTALAAILKEPPQNEPILVRDRVKEVCLSRDGVEVLEPLGFENTFAIIVRRKDSEQLGLRTIGDLRKYQATFKGGYGPEFMSRADGYTGLIKAYGLNFTEPAREFDRNLLYQAVAQGTLDLAAGDSTDGRISALDLVVLEDDRRYFPPYEAIPMANIASLSRHEGLRDALNALAGSIDTQNMQKMNFEVDRNHREPESVAREFLITHKLLKK